MILSAYVAAAVITVVVATAAPRWMRTRPERVTQARVLAGAVAAGYAAVVVSVVAVAQLDAPASAAWIFAIIPLAGAVVYILGLLRWSGLTAWVLRLIGWLLMIGPGVVPSLLTLLLPVAAALAATLYRAPPLSGPVSGARTTDSDGSAAPGA